VGPLRTAGSGDPPKLAFGNHKLFDEYLREQLNVPEEAIEKITAGLGSGRNCDVPVILNVSTVRQFRSDIERFGSESSKPLQITTATSPGRTSKK
jgi:hypothetical protein